MAHFPTADTYDFLVVLQILTIENLLDLLHALGQEVALLVPVLPLTSFAVAALPLPTVADHVAKLIAPKAHDLLRTPIHGVLEGQAVNAEELLRTVRAVVADSLAAEAPDLAVEVAGFVWRVFFELFSLTFGFYVQFAELADQVGGLSSLTEPIAQQLVIVDGLVLELLVEGLGAFLDIQRQPRSQLLQQLLYYYKFLLDRQGIANRPLLAIWHRTHLIFLQHYHNPTPVNPPTNPHILSQKSLQMPVLTTGHTIFNTSKLAVQNPAVCF